MRSGESISIRGSRAQPHPGWGVVAGIGLAANPTVNAGFGQPRSEGRIQKQEIDPPAGIFFPMLAEVIPEGVNALLGKAGADGIGPALSEQTLTAGASLGPQQGVLQIGTWIVDVE